MPKFALACIASAALLAAPVPGWAQLISDVEGTEDLLPARSLGTGQVDSAPGGATVGTHEGAPERSAENLHLNYDVCATVVAMGADGLRLSPPSLQVHLDRLREYLPVCQKNPTWLAYMGQVSNQLGRYSEAAEYLERALMLLPDSLPVQLQYALALAGSGDALASLHLLRDLESQPGLPASLRVAVKRQIARWAYAPAVEPWRIRHHLATRLGYDNNLLGAPNLTSLTLTLPGQNLRLPLDTNYLRTTGAYTWFEIGVAGAKGPWQWSSTAGARHSSAAPAAATQQLQASGEYAAQGRFASATLGMLSGRSGTRYRTLGWAAGWQLDGTMTFQVRGEPAVGSTAAAGPQLNTAFIPAGGETAPPQGNTGIGDSSHTCQTRVGPELQYRQIDSSPLLSGRYVGVLLQRTCQVQGVRGVAAGANDHAASSTDRTLQAWQVSARWGADTPTNNESSASGYGGVDGVVASSNSVRRAGGRQQQGGVRIVALGRGLAYRHQWLLDAEVFLQADAEGYSSLLEGGARRRMQRVVLRGQYNLPLPQAPQWQLVAGIEWQQQRSNLVLFQQQSHGVYFGLRRQW